MTDDTVLRIELKNEAPVDLADYAAALSAVADEYRGFVIEECPEVVSTSFRLYVKEMKSGSTIADLVAMAPLALPFIENANTVISFAEYLKRAITALLHRQERTLSPRTLGNLTTIVEPVAKDNASQLNMQTVIQNQTINNYITVNSVEANAIQNAARLELEKTEAPITGSHSKVVLYLHQARNDPRSHSGDRARIDSLFPNPIKVIFGEDALKAAIVGADDNPFKSAYLVDVDVETVRGRPILYKVTALHERLDLPGEPDAA
jgi:hypothetical protein